MAEITRAVVTCIRNRGPQPDSGSAGKAVQYDLDIAKETLSTEDRHKIDSIEWLIFDPKQRAEALRQANAVGRYFLAMRKFKGEAEVLLVSLFLLRISKSLSSLATIECEMSRNFAL